IMTGNFPFYDENNIMVIVRLATGNLPTVGDNQQLSQLQALCSLMTDCWSIEPSKRPTSSSCTEYINRWMDWVIPSRRTADGSSETQSVDLLVALGKVNLSNGKINEAIRYFQRAADIARSTMQDWKHACAIFDLAKAYVIRNNYAKAEALYIEARDTMSRTGDKHQLGHILTALGDVYLFLNDYAKAEASYVEARQVLDLLPNQECGAYNTIQLGMLYRRTNECDKAEALCKEARDTFVRLRSVQGALHATLALGHVYLRQGEYQKAEAAYAEAHGVFTRTSDIQCLISSALGLGHVYRLCDEYAKAETMYNKTLPTLIQLGNKRFTGIVLLGLAEIKEKQMQSAEAEHHLKDAITVFNEFGWEDGLPECDMQIKSLYKRIKPRAEEGEVRELE
ncbi:hypothetical protein FRC05_009475, partial [Tulasnella sp. 425]